VTSLDDLRVLKGLEPLGVTGVIVGRALYEGRFTVTEALQVLDTPQVSDTLQVSGTTQVLDTPQVSDPPRGAG